MKNQFFRKTIFILWMLLCQGVSFALVSTSVNLSDYYYLANGKSGDAIRKALEGIIDEHTIVSYDDLYNLYVASDSRADGSIWDMYSTCSWQHGKKKCGNYSSVCDCYNREHSIPQSWFSERSPMKSDAFHVYPTDGKVNNQRSNYMFGECAGGTSLSSDALGRVGSSTFTGASVSGKVFEPDDEYKGDFARTYFYMATRYATNCTSWGNHFGSNSGLTAYSVALFLKWHREDPVSEKELIRNEAIFGNKTYNSTGYKQGNRNPFIDFPCLAEYIWGEYKGKTIDFSTLLSAYSEEYASGVDKTGCECENENPTFLTPKSGESIIMSNANLNEVVTTQLLISGRNLVDNVSFSISGANASLFKVSPTSISAVDANNGQYVTLSYKPTTTGEHSANLTLTAKNTTSVTVVLKGACEEAIISPSGTLYFETTDATTSVQEDVLIKGTNLSSGVVLTLSGSDKFELSKKTFTAAEITDGSKIVVSYQPRELGVDTAVLYTTSGSFTTTTYLIGNCSFEALPATELTKNSFVANWTNAGVDSYVLDVYKKDIVGTAETVVLQDDCNKATTATTDGSVNFDVDGCVRLGSGSKTGSITYSGLDLSKGGKVVINAQYYNTDTGTQMKVTLGDVTKTFTLTSSFENYEFEIEKSESNTFVSLKIESLVSKKRININSVQVITGGESVSKISVIGYPKTVGAVQSYMVEGVDYTTADYYYTVTPLNSMVSNEILVEENSSDSNENSATDAPLETKLLSYLNGNVWTVEGIEKGSILTLMNISGVVLERTIASQSLVKFSLPISGVYIIHIENLGNRTVLKTVY